MSVCKNFNGRNGIFTANCEQTTNDEAHTEQERKRMTE